MKDSDLSERDKTILRYVHQYRLLKSQDHIQPLLGGSARVLRNCKALADAGYLNRVQHKNPYKQIVYAIGNRGITFLARDYDLRRPYVNKKASNSRLQGINFEHTYLIAQTMIAIEIAARGHPEVRFITPEEIYNRSTTPEAARRWFTKERFFAREKRFRVTARIKPPGTEEFEATIYADWMFGLEYGKPEERRQRFFVLEADRGGMPVETNNFKRSSIIKKLYVYRAAGLRRRVVVGNTERRQSTIFEDLFGIPNIQALFIVDPVEGHDGEKRIPNCVNLSKKLTGGPGGRQFLFAPATWPAAEDIFTAPLIDGTGTNTTIVPLESKA